MNFKLKSSLGLIFGCMLMAQTSDLTIRLKGVGPIVRRTAQYSCDATGMKLGLPKGTFPVEYINAGESSLALLPIHNQTMIFANVTAGSGARYVAQGYQWWEAAGRSITLRQEFGPSPMESVCQPAK